MSTHVLRFYLLLHDCASATPTLDQSSDVLEQLKTHYGLNAALLPLNSRAPLGPTVQVETEGMVTTSSHPSEEGELVAYWGERYRSALGSSQPASNFARGLGLNDTESISSFLRSFTAQSLVPWMERSVQQWQLTLFDSRRGLTSRLWSGLTPSSTSRRLWGVGRTASLSLAPSTAKSALGAAVSRVGSVKEQPTTSSDAPGGGSPLASAAGASGEVAAAAAADAKVEKEELSTIPPTNNAVQMRRLADFALVLHDYTFAITCYEAAHKDLAGTEAGQAGQVYAASAVACWGVARLLHELERKANLSPTTLSTSSRANTPLVESDAGVSLDQVRSYLGPLAAAGNVSQGEATFLLLQALELQYPLLRTLKFTKVAATQMECTASLARLAPQVRGILYEQAALMRLLPSDPPSLEQPARRKAALDLHLAARSYACIVPAAATHVAQRAWNAVYDLDSVSKWKAAHAGIAAHLIHTPSLSSEQKAKYLVQLLRTPQLPPEWVNHALEELSLCEVEEFDLGSSSFVSSDTIELMGPPSNADVNVSLGCGTTDGEDEDVEQYDWFSLIRRTKDEVASGKCSISPEDRKVLMNKVSTKLDQATHAPLRTQFGVKLTVRNPWNCEVRIANVVMVWNTESVQPLAATDSLATPLEPYDQITLKRTYLGTQVGTFRPIQLRYTLLTPTEQPVRCTQVLEQTGTKVIPRNVWGKEDFDDLIPTYETDHTWDLVVEPPSAQVDIQVDGWEQSTYEGQDVVGTLTLRNPSEQEAVTSLRFVVDSPECVVLSCANPGQQHLKQEKDEEKEKEEEQERVVQPLNLYQPYLSPLTTALDPGAETRVVIRVRASNVGYQSIHVLLLYSTASGTTRQGRIQLGMYVHPLLELDVKSMSVRGKEDSWRLVCTSTNLSSSEMVQVENVHVLSSAWTVARRAQQQQQGEEGRSPLPPLQNQVVLLDLLPVQEDQEAGKQVVQYTVHQLAHWLKEKSVDKSLSASPHISLHHSHLGSTDSPRGKLSPLYTQAKRAYYRSLYRSTLPHIPSAIRDRILLAYERYSVDLCVSWSVGHQQRGCTYVFDIPCAPNQSLLQPVSEALSGRRKGLLSHGGESLLQGVVRDLERSRWGTNQDPIQVGWSRPTYSASGSPSFTAQTTVATFCVRLHNHSPERSCTVRLALLDGGSQVQWIGRTTFKVQVGARQRTTVTVRALVMEESHLPPYRVQVSMDGMEHTTTTVGFPGQVVRPR